MMGQPSSLPATAMIDDPTVFRDFVARLGDGENGAAAELLDRYFNRLVGLAERHFHRRYRGPEEPADAVCSALRTFLAHVGRFRLDTDDQLRRLLFEITVHKCLTRNARYAAARRDPGRVDADADLAALLSHEPTADAAAGFHELLARLDAVVRDWPALDQAVVERALVGEKPRDTADALGVPEGQVYRVRDRLKRLLDRFRRES